MVRALAFHPCVPGSIPGHGVICGLSLLLVLFLAPRGFSPGTPVFPSPQKPTFPNSNSLWNCQALYHEPLARVIAQALPVFDIKFDLICKLVVENFLFSPLATRHSPLATRHSPLATRHSPLATIHCVARHFCGL